MSDTSKREWRFYLDDMIDFAEKVMAYTEGLDQVDFETSGMTYDATFIFYASYGKEIKHRMQAFYTFAIKRSEALLATEWNIPGPPEICTFILAILFGPGIRITGRE